MGHYERLLLTALSQADMQRQYSFDFVFSGRRNSDIGDWESPIPQLQGGRMLGLSTARLAKLPWRVARTLVGLIERGKPSVYHSLALSFPAPSCRPAVYTIHDLPPARFDDEGTVPRWAKQAVGEAAAIHVPSEFAKRELMELLDLPDSKIHVIRYGCETEVFHPGVVPKTAEELAVLGIRSPYLIYVGGYTRRKNIAALLDAWRTISKCYPEIQLVLAGPKQPLEAMVQESDVTRVVAAGYLGRADMPGVLKASEGLVFPSIYEGFGLPPLEAMATGVPVVSTRSGAIPEVVGRAGILAETGEAGAIAQAVMRLLGDRVLADELKKLGPERAATFSWQRHGQEMLELYNRVASK